MKWFETRVLLQIAASLAEADSKKSLAFKELRNAAVTY
jgi:hypothetical protein